MQLPAIPVRDILRDGMLGISLDLVDSKFELRVKEHVRLKPKSQRLLTDHAAAISKLAQSLKLQGEALIMFLTSRPDMWDQLELANALS